MAFGGGGGRLGAGLQARHAINISQQPRESDNVTRVSESARERERDRKGKRARSLARERERQIERETGLTELVAETGVATADIKDAPCLAHARLSQCS